MVKAEAPVEEPVDMIVRGELRRPEMPRRSVWRPTRVRDLLDSLYHSSPSGAPLLWETDKAVPPQEFAVEQLQQAWKACVPGDVGIDNPMLLSPSCLLVTLGYFWHKHSYQIGAETLSTALSGSSWSSPTPCSAPSTAANPPDATRPAACQPVCSPFAEEHAHIMVSRAVTFC